MNWTSLMANASVQEEEEVPDAPWHLLRHV